MIDSSFVESIEELADAKTGIHRIGAEEHLVHNGAVIRSAVVKKPAPATLTVHTLTGLRDYLQENRDKLAQEEVAVHVVSPTSVDVVSRTDEVTEQRFTHLTATCYDRFAALPMFKFGVFIDHEVMIIALMALFEPSPDREALVDLLSNVQQVSGRTDEDDGISQVATVRTGISMKAERTIPNPVTLVPHRSFVEIEQPASRFVVRARQSEEGQKGAIALFEADGGAWRDYATGKIREWLQVELPAGVAILA